MCCLARARPFFRVSGRPLGITCARERAPDARCSRVALSFRSSAGRCSALGRPGAPFDTTGFRSFLSLGAASRPHIEQATQEFYEAQVELDFGGEIQRWLSNPAIVGAYSSHAQIASTFGLALASPLLERRVIELVLGIPADGCSARAPRPSCQKRPRDAFLTRYVGNAKTFVFPSTCCGPFWDSAGARRSLRDWRVRDRLEGWIRFERVEGILDAIGRGYDPNDDLFWSQITGLVSFAYWYSRASREYGVS